MPIKKITQREIFKYATLRGEGAHRQESKSHECILLEYLTLGCAGIANDTDIDVPSKVSFFCRDFGNSTKQHEKHPTFDLIIS